MKEVLTICRQGVAVLLLCFGLELITGLGIFRLLGGIVCVALTVRSLLAASDNDPASRQIEISHLEHKRAVQRLASIDATLRELTTHADIRPLATTRFSNFNAYYHPILHRVHISRALCARLSDWDLRIVLAHEVAHATNRNRCIQWSLTAKSRLEEEIRADAQALQMLQLTAAQWKCAMDACARAEHRNDYSEEFEARCAALGLIVPVSKQEEVESVGRTRNEQH